MDVDAGVAALTAIVVAFYLILGVLWAFAPYLEGRIRTRWWRRD